MSKFKYSIGLTNGTISHFLVDDDTEARKPSTDDNFLVDSKYMLDDLYVKITKTTSTLMTSWSALPMQEDPRVLKTPTSPKYG